MKYSIQLNLAKLFLGFTLTLFIPGCNNDEKNFTKSTIVKADTKESTNNRVSPTAATSSSTADTGKLNRSATENESKTEIIQAAGPKEKLQSSATTTSTGIRVVETRNPEIGPAKINSTETQINTPPAPIDIAGNGEKPTSTPGPDKEAIDNKPTQNDPVPVVTTIATPIQDNWPVPIKAKNKINPVTADGESLSSGKSLYQKHCSSCHGKSGMGNGPKAAQLKTELSSFKLPIFQSQSDGSLFYKINEGRDDMPGYKKKIPDEEEIWSIVNYLRTLK